MAPEQHVSSKGGRARPSAVTMLIWVLAPALVAPCSSKGGASSSVGSGSSTGLSFGIWGTEPAGTPGHSSASSSSTGATECDEDAGGGLQHACIDHVCVFAGCSSDLECDAESQCLCNAC